MKFDEHLFYQPEEEEPIAIPMRISQELADLLHIPEEILEANPVADLLDVWDALGDKQPTQSTESELGGADTEEPGSVSGQL